MLKIVLLTVGILVISTLIVVLIGFLLPKGHVACRAIALHRKPEDVFQLISDFKAAPSWRSDVRNVELLPPSNGHICYRERGANGVLTMEIVESRPPARMGRKNRRQSPAIWGRVDFRYFPNCRRMPLEHYGTR